MIAERIDPVRVLREARERAAREEHQRRVEMARIEAEHRSLASQREALIRDFLFPGSGAEYEIWLHGWVLNGGEIGHVYNYPMRDHNLYVAMRDIESIPKLCGAQSLEIIVPVHVKAPKLTGHMPYGHSTLYFMEGFELYGADKPSLYSDINF